MGINAITMGIWAASKAPTAPSSSIPTDGLIVEWSFDSISGSSVTDTSPVATHTGTISGATTVSGKKGNGLSFDGVNDYCSTPDSSDLRASVFSVSFWIKTTTSSNVVIAEKDGNGGWSIQVSNTNPLGAGGVAGRITFACGGFVPSVYGTTLINDNNFHHVVAINNGSSDFLYIDNVNVKVNNTQGNPIYSTGPLILGQRVGNEGPFPGVIDQFRFYNRALTVAEVAQLYNEQ